MQIYNLVQGQLLNNLFVISNKNTNVLIDPGLDTDKIENWLESLGFEIDAILVFHGHFDHTASVKYFQEKYNCEVYFGKEDDFYLKDPFGPLNGVGNNLNLNLDLDFNYTNTTNGEIKAKI